MGKLHLLLSHCILDSAFSTLRPRNLDGRQNLNLKPSLDLKPCKPLTLNDTKLKHRNKIYQNATTSFYTKNSTPDQHSSEQSSLRRSLKHAQTLSSRRQASFGQ